MFSHSFTVFLDAFIQLGLFNNKIERATILK